MYGVRWGSNFILLHVAVHVSPFISETILSPLYILGSCVEN